MMHAATARPVVLSASLPAAEAISAKIKGVSRSGFRNSALMRSRASRTREKFCTEVWYTLAARGAPLYGRWQRYRAGRIKHQWRGVLLSWCALAVKREVALGIFGMPGESQMFDWRR